MAAITARVPDFVQGAHKYNPVYSAVLESLEKEIPELLFRHTGMTREDFARSCRDPDYLKGLLP